MILSSSSPEESDLQTEKFLEIYEDATDLYSLIHYRFIHSPRGLGIMREKYLSGRFGTCPRLMCERHNVLPLGTSEELRKSRVKVYCPRCEDVYIPKQKYSDVDGAFFGCSFPHVLLSIYSECVPTPPKTVYIPKIYGFKVYGKKGSKYTDSKEICL